MIHKTLRYCTIALCFAVQPAVIEAQVFQVPVRDTIEVVAGKEFAKGALYRSLFGTNYRNEWTTRIRVPVLDLDRLAGGVTAYKLGGGKQTKSIRLIAADSTEYVFRPVYKSETNLPDKFRGTLVWKIVRDYGSGSHPAATVAPPPILTATGIAHPTPVLVVMPDDPRLGEWRSEFAGVIGTIEEYPRKSGTASWPSSAIDVIDSDELHLRMNRSSSDRVDAHEMLKAVIVDMLLGDNDRHPGQFKWFRTATDSLWTPVPRDRDKVFLSYEGSITSLARTVMPSLVQFRETYPDITALFQNAVEFDARVLSPLNKADWDSTARWVQAQVTDAVIDDALARLPLEYAPSTRRIGEILRVRRDHLREAALGYYDQLYRTADIHATDAADRAALNRAADGSVSLTIQDQNQRTWYDRTFLPSETMEIRLYLHGGDDVATVTGTRAPGIKIRVIGGNGNNSLTDNTGTARLYDEGLTSGAYYTPDSLEDDFPDAANFNKAFNRRPWVYAFGRLNDPQKESGAEFKPVIGLSTGHELGAIPKIGVARYGYGFRRYPYSSMLQATAEMATTTRGLRFRLLGDKRFISSDFHLPFEAMMSQLEVVQFRGFGNQVEDRNDRFVEVRQRMWQARPGIGFSFHPGSDFSIGPIVRYTTTDSVANRFISQARPTGFPTFKQAGAQALLHFESRIEPDTLRPRFVIDGSASAYPALLDVNEAYESAEGFATAYITVPLPKYPVLALHAGGKKLWGDFPYFDAAFLGGGNSFRTEYRQRFAGDASAFGSAEVRYPIVDFPFILPMTLGAIGFADAARVYVDGESPGGWHTAFGGGFWVSALKPGYNLNVFYTNNPNRRVVLSLGFSY